MTEQRRLAAILAADVAGYSRLVGADEAGTLARLRSLRAEVIEPQAARHAGRLFKAMGDGFLVEFASAVQAVTCGLAIQEANRTGALALRIGIHLGDVVVEGDDLMGDGVNIAARLEGVAEPGGIALSRQVHDQVRDRLDAQFEDRGEVALKNIARPVHVFALAGRSAAAALHRPSPATGARGGLPVLAVLPFQNRSSDAEQEYFSDGITEDIITGLSKVRAFHVIARNTTFAFKGNALDIARIGSELKADYLVEGSVRSLGNRVRITAQLIDVAQGTTLWAERYDRELKDVFEVQDEITARIAAGVDPAIRDDQTRRALGKHPADLKAWDHLLRGLWHINRFRKEANAEARRELEAGLSRDPGFAVAHAWLAMTHVFDAHFNWTDRHAEHLERAGSIAAEAVRLSDSEPMSHVAMAMARFWTGRMDQARHSAERALALNPNSFLASFICGAATNYSGQCAAAVPYHLKALDLSPNDPLAWNCLGSLAHTYLNLDKHEDAVTCADRAIVRRHGYLFARLVKIAALGHAGRIGDARAAVGALFDVAPDFTLSRLDHYPFVLASQKDHLLRGLALAGLGTPAAPAPGAAPALALPDRPSIAVLPFQNMSGDPEQEYFADGIVEDIITALSRFKSLFVIARNSSFTYKGRAVDIKQVGRDLGVRYVLEGSVRKAGGQVRITGQLIDSQTGAHLWADRFDAPLKDVFDLQDRVTSSVVSAIAPKIDRTEIERARRRPPDNLDAYDLYLRGMARLYEHTKEGWQAALRQFTNIIELFPDYAPAHAMAARCQAFLHGQGWSGDRTQARIEVRRLAAHVATAAQDDAVALSAAGYALFRVSEDDEMGAGLVDQALSLNPNIAMAWAYRGAISIFLGDYATGLEQLSHGMRLNPLDPEIYWSETIAGNGNIALGKYREAAKWAAQALIHRPSYMPAVWVLASANALAGNLDEARALLPKIRAGNPEMRISNLANYVPNRRPDVLQKFAEAMRLVSMPE